jgi:hypothetical protein
MRRKGYCEFTETVVANSSVNSWQLNEATEYIIYIYYSYKPNNTVTVVANFTPTLRSPSYFSSLMAFNVGKLS